MILLCALQAFLVLQLSFRPSYPTHTPTPLRAPQCQRQCPGDLLSLIEPDITPDTQSAHTDYPSVSADLLGLTTLSLTCLKSLVLHSIYSFSRPSIFISLLTTCILPLRL